MAVAIVGTHRESWCPGIPHCTHCSLCVLNVPTLCGDALRDGQVVFRERGSWGHEWVGDLAQIEGLATSA